MTLPGLELRPVGHRVRSQWLYGLQRRNVSHFLLAVKTACLYKEGGAEHRSSCDEGFLDFDDGRDQLHVQNVGRGGKA
jgi:hypothetical protein